MHACTTGLYTAVPACSLASSLPASRCCPPSPTPLGCLPCTALGLGGGVFQRVLQLRSSPTRGLSGSALALTDRSCRATACWAEHSLSPVIGAHSPQTQHGPGRSMLLRVRLTSFLAGVALAGSAALYQLRQDIWDSHSILAAQVPPERSTGLRRPQSGSAKQPTSKLGSQGLQTCCYWPAPCNAAEESQHETLGTGRQYSWSRSEARHRGASHPGAS